ncbi:ABC transporter substrate-binding protein [Fusibacter ferrireducens]|uniref:Sugar ABC transporter substrate-binding protein n=1 Tax=Fusibacter ferrireducens TaxID=2785058 RepID=A0ABR9ZNC5_9FIRM|nr:sugar ABC transporter substrate-binding protein [Fusibacter ferrireducens]MBF4691970.1 sugar ABC transporter substrate-binding protein [Fusibacter ferrireducens]
MKSIFMNGQSNKKSDVKQRTRYPKLFIGILILAMLLGMLSGCAQKAVETNEPTPDASSSTAPEATDTTTTKEPVEIKYMTFSAAPDHLEDLDAMIAEFEKQNPDIKVTYETYSFADYFTKLQTVVASKTAPDTFELNYENFVTYASKKALYNMDDLMKADADFDSSIFNSTALNAFKYDSKQYGLVESFSNVVFFYNKDLFDKANLDYPNDSWTWKDELAAAQKLTDADAGIFGTYAPIQFWEFYKTIEQNGGKIFNDDKTEVVIDSKENIETLQWMIDKIEKYHVSPSDAQMSGQSDGDLFKAGKIAMLRTGIWMFDSFKDADFTWDIALEPGNTQKAHHFFANGVAISKDTKNAEAAWKWAKFLTSSKEAAKIRVDSSWELPALTDESLLTSYLEKTPPESRAVVFKALDTLVVPPVIGNWNELTDLVGKELDQAKLGQKTPEQALKDAKTAIEGILE